MIKNHKIQKKLYELGKTIDLDDYEINHAKKMMKTMMGMFIIVGIFTLIGIFSSRLEAIGLWYASVSIKDFHLFRFF